MDTLTTSDVSCSSSSIADNEGRQLDEDAILAAKLASEEMKQERDCASDAALALMLQRQFDLEFDSQLKREEARRNGHSKVGISLDRYRRSATIENPTSLNESDELLYYSDDSDIDENDSRLAWDVFEQTEMKQRSRMMGRSGFVLDADGNMITKHDIPTSSRKNMCRLMELKTDIQTGDAGASKDDFKITNYVYNSLRAHSKKNSRRATQRLFERKERDSTALPEDIQASKMNDSTRAIVDGMMVSLKIENLNGVIGYGKESTVLHAMGRNHEDIPGQEIAVKIFKSNYGVAFKTRDSYNKSKCPSYKFDRPRSKHDSINKWAERGFKNLKLLRKANINCPDAISLKKHVLVMTFLGSEAIPSPQLKEANLDGDQLRSSYEQVIDIMERMYKECNLIHGDLSEYNLLWHNGQIYVIDVSQSMFSSHPNANSFLFRDCKNIIEFYRKSGLTGILDDKALFMLICGKDLSKKDVELWSKIEDFPRNEKLMQKDENADKKFEKADSFSQMLSIPEKKEALQETNC